jgi:hypothetical protein
VAVVGDQCDGGADGAPEDDAGDADGQEAAESEGAVGCGGLVVHAGKACRRTCAAAVRGT